MQTFLAHIINQVEREKSLQWHEVAYIIPNKRAAVYIHSYLSNVYGKALFAPEIITINEWIDQHTPERIVPQTELLFLLYEVHQEIEAEAAESFNDFIKWGKIMLSDFDEIDRYLLEANTVFKDLRQIKEIENWSFDAEVLSKGQEEFMRLWDKLPRYYELLHQRLKTNSETYQGAAYRRFYSRIAGSEFSLSLKKQYYFVGFNALSRSEEAIIEALRKNKRAAIFFDMDAFYVENPAHEAGHFYRKFLQKWRPDSSLESCFNETPKTIQIIETAQQIAQTKIAGGIVNDIVEKYGDANDTAIVLADESMLIPLMQSLPASVGKANITMGYPIRFSHLKGLIDIVFEIQLNFQKFDETQLYHKSLLNYLDHPYFQLMINDNEKVNNFEKAIVENNKIFVSWQELKGEFPVLMNLEEVFRPWENPLMDGFLAFNQLVEGLYEHIKSQEKAYEIDLEIMYHFTKGFQRFEEISKKYPHEVNLRSFKQLFYQFWQTESLSFLGNPIEGVANNGYSGNTSH